MLTLIIFRLLTLVGVATGVAATGDARDEVVTSPRVAQVRLAEALGTADSIHSVTAHGNTITFAITRGDRPLFIRATTDRRHAVLTVAITAGAVSDGDLGGLAWLADELESATAVTKLEPDDDGAVTITTADGRRYMAIPGRGSGGSIASGNAAVEARWAAEWNR
jgi:hypothetical protein